MRAENSELVTCYNFIRLRDKMRQLFKLRRFTTFHCGNSAFKLHTLAVEVEVTNVS